jgi:hypothetical protein
LIGVFAGQCRAAKTISAPYLFVSIEFEFMVAMEGIEKLKQQYTDKYVVVDATVPELARFRNAVGQVKTVNMNGRALVEFDQWANIGWYDIELDFLKVVPKPEPKPTEAKKAPEKAAAEKPAAAKPAAAKPPAAAPAGKQSTADILAAARAKKGAAPAAAPAAKAAPAEKPAAATKPAAGGKLSTADILAAARGKAPAAAPAAKKPEPKPAAPEPAEEPAAEPVVEAPAPKAEPAKKTAGGAKPTTTAEKIAYCRKVDAKS